MDVGVFVFSLNVWQVSSDVTFSLVISVEKNSHASSSLLLFSENSLCFMGFNFLFTDFCSRLYFLFSAYVAFCFSNSLQNKHKILISVIY